MRHDKNIGSRYSSQDPGQLLKFWKIHFGIEFEELYYLPWWYFSRSHCFNLPAWNQLSYVFFSTNKHLQSSLIQPCSHNLYSLEPTKFRIFRTQQFKTWYQLPWCWNITIIVDWRSKQTCLIRFALLNQDLLFLPEDDRRYAYLYHRKWLSYFVFIISSQSMIYITNIIEIVYTAK